ncbi:MAG: methyltransferase domain-containing protein [Clostridia bacterium]|nr:methyltransferase domain-containing protein [Clostridia bacterium]
MFLCPICHKELSRANNSFRCENNHCYDIASSGYVNLLNPGKRNNAKAGDSKEMVRARSGFFTSGAYAPISDMLCSLVSTLKRDIIVDAGCGEGYYTCNIAKSNTESRVLGFDVSKFGCEHGSKIAKRDNLSNLFFSVGNIFELPLKNDFADIIINAFAPVANTEFLRVLKPGGHLIVLSAGVDHLIGLKKLLYEDTYQNEEKIPHYEGFDTPIVKNLRYDTKIIGNDTIKNLFTMTPYYFRTSLEDKKKLDGVSEINTTIEVNFAIYKKL